MLLCHLSKSSLIKKLTYDSIASKTHIQPLQKSEVKLKTYTGELFGILGEAKVKVNYGEIKHNLVMRVVDGKGSNLLGRDWLSSLKLTVNNIHNLSTPSAVHDVVDRHATVFTEKLGTLKGTEVKLHVDPQVQPQFCKALSVLLAFKAKV